jgi:signal transduction histidine kinase
MGLSLCLIFFGNYLNESLRSTGAIRAISFFFGPETLSQTWGFLIITLMITFGFRMKWLIPGWLLVIGLAFTVDYLEAHGLNFAKFQMNAMLLVIEKPFLGKVAGVFAGIISAAFIKGSFNFIRNQGRELIERHNIKSYKQGTCIFSQGDKNDYIYVVMRGLVELKHRRNGDSVVLDNVKEGSVFGEMGVLQNERCYATATTLEDTCVYRMKLSELNAKLGRYEHPAVLISHVLAERLSKQDKAKDAEVQAKEEAKVLKKL